MKMTKKKYYLTQEEINDSYETISTAVPDKVRLAILLKNKGVKFENVSSLTFLVEPIFSGTLRHTRTLTPIPFTIFRSCHELEIQDSKSRGRDGRGGGCGVFCT